MSQSALALLLIIPSVLGALPLDCSYQCSGNDVEVTAIQITDQNGNNLACRYCEPLSPASAYLALTVVNHAAAPRYNLYIIYTLSLDGVDQPRTFTCESPSIGGGQTIRTLIPFSWTCGQTVALKNIVLTWSTVANENTCNILANCHPPGQSWCTPLISVRTPLVVDFASNSPQCVCIPQRCSPIQFTDLTKGGSGIYTYNWNFGDGSASTQKNPAKQYSAPGIYQVTLTVSDGTCSDSHTRQVMVYPAPSASFTVDSPTLCFRPTVSTAFHAQVIEGSGIYTSFNWDFGDGNTGSGQNPIHKYENQGSYNVRLTVTDSHGCTGTTIAPVTVIDCDPPGIDGVTVFSEPICQGEGLVVNAHVVDYVGVTSVVLRYQVNGGAVAEKRMAFVPASGSVKDGLWTADIPGQPAGSIVTYWVAAGDGTFTGESAHYSVAFIDCTPPAIASVSMSSSRPCAGTDVLIIVHATAGTGVVSVTINYGGASYPMSGPSGSSSGTWTYTIPGSGKKAGDVLTFTVSAMDAMNREVQSSIFNIIWRDCTPPEFVSVVPSELSPCPPADVIITATITDDVGVVSAVLTYDGVDHPMSGPSASSEWTATIPGSGRSAGSFVDYTVTAYDAAGNSFTGTSGRITWRDCSAPVVQSVDISPDYPCAGDNVVITASVFDSTGVQSVSLVINSVPYSVAGPSGNDWFYAIAGKGAGESITCYISAEDTEGNIATSSIFTITWKDCTDPVIGTAAFDPVIPCSGEDVFVSVNIIDDVGVTSATLSCGGTSYQMSGPLGTATDGVWTATIIGAGRNPGDSLSYSITAKDGEGNSPIPATGTITWIDCTPPVVSSVTPSSSTPCAGTDVIITVHATDDVGVDSVNLRFDSADHAMSGPTNSKEGDWTYTIPGRPAGTSFSYSIVSNDGTNPSSPVSGTIKWRDCSDPDTIGPDLVSINPSTVSPCFGTDVVVTALVRDANGVVSVDLVYDGASHPMSGIAGSMEGYWSLSISGTGRFPGSSLSYIVKARDALGNLAASGEFTIKWTDCAPPHIGPIDMSPLNPCAGEDVIIAVQISDNFGVASATLTAGGTDYIMSGPVGSASGEWTATIPGTGKGPGYTLIYSISASDAAGNMAPQAIGQIYWRDCESPDIQSVIPSNSEPCAGKDVTVTAHIEDSDGVASAILNFDSSAISMSGPIGSTSGDWTITIPGAGKMAGETVSYSIEARDNSGKTTVSDSKTISWQDCTSPHISEISPGDIEICEGEDMEITARIAASAGISFAYITYEVVGSIGSYQVDMSRTGSDATDSIWHGAIPGKADRTVTYSITASTGKFTSTSETHRIKWMECDVPVLLEHQEVNPCAGTDVQVSYTIRDADIDAYLVTISYDGKEYPLILQGDNPFPLVGTWIGSIPGDGRQVGDNLSYVVNVYTKDTLGANPPGGFGPYLVNWIDCSPGMTSVVPESTEVCAGNDQSISVRATSPYGVSSVILYYTDSAGQYSTNLIADDGGSPTDALWTGSIPDQPEATVVEYYIVATTSNGYTTRMPEDGSYGLNWIACNPIKLNKTASPSTVAPGGLITYTIVYQNIGRREITGVVITESYPRGTVFLSASPPPDGGTIDTWTIGTIPPASSGQIVITLMAPERTNVTFTQVQEVAGSGFVNIYKQLSTEERPIPLQNIVTLSSTNGIMATASATVALGGEVGTEMTLKEHGSGQSSGQDRITLMTSNRSIETSSDLSASYHPTSFGLPHGRSIDYTARWAVDSSAKNKVTGASMHESYRYAESIERYSYIKMDKNGSQMNLETNLDGSAHIGVLKKSLPLGSPGRRGNFSNIFESGEDYTGSFHIGEYVDEYGKNVQADRNVSGNGYVAVDRRIRNTQRTYESGTGSYSVDEMIRTHTNFIVKDINVTHFPAGYSYSPSFRTDSSLMWEEGMRSQSPGSVMEGGDLLFSTANRSMGYATYIGEEISGADRIRKETMAKGLNEMDSSMSFSGQATFRTVLEPGFENESEKIDQFEEYSGQYDITRRTIITGVAKYDQPHIYVMKEGETRTAAYNGTSDATLADYRITVINDGIRSLGPVYVRDIFPPGTSFINASLRPSELTGDHANWTLTHLAVGGYSTIDLTLNVTEMSTGDLVNRVEVFGSYDGQGVAASNYTVNYVSWLGCCPPEIQVEKTGWIDRSDPGIVWYRITLKNMEQYSMVASITDHMPTDMSFLNASPESTEYWSSSIVWTILDLPPGESRTIVYRVEAEKDGSYINTAHIEVYAIDGRDVADADVSARVDVGGVQKALSYSSGWEPPACFGIGCDASAEATGPDWVRCPLCGGS